MTPRIFAGLAEEEVRSILAAARHRHFPAGSVVAHQGDAAERLYLLANGRGRHFVTAHHGQKILLYWLTAGQIFGGAALLFDPFHYLASTELLLDSCVLVWTRETMRAIAARYPRVLDNVLSIAVTESAAWLISAQVSLSSDDARGRLANLLVGLAMGIGTMVADGVELKVTNEDLAAGANVTPFTVSRLMREWQRSGVVAKRRGRVVLRKPELLGLVAPEQRRAQRDNGKIAHIITT
ncbi:MAG: Crp/Fnr family transcriptional regulator [Silvibacterium sp.]|nr:Crp/Fnr family transcriptional regulator [Silvibacterium sp.]MBV8437010.1 Crp/Fnr family transcriptional regulator [Silvibacterium sp.]